MSARAKFVVAVFPGAANAPLYDAAQSGDLARRGLDVEIVDVRSSTEQMELWESGGCDVMHTSPDHLVRERRSRDPIIVRRDPFGELRIYRRPEAGDLASVTWAVDAVASGFAFVMRALLEDQAGLPAGEQRLEPVGGTMQRFETLLDPDSGIGGTTLHPPFDGMSEAAGMVAVAGHLASWPQLLTQVTVVPRSALGSEPITVYLEALDASAARLAGAGAAAIEAVLRGRGMSRTAARAGAAGLLGPGGLAEDRRPSLDGLQPVAELRARFAPGWEPPAALDELLAA